MFSTIKSRIITIFAIVLLITIISSITIGILISQKYINQKLYNDMGVVYKVDSGEELGNIVSGEFFSQDRLMNEYNMQEQLTTFNPDFLLAIVSITSFCLIIIFGMITNFFYNKFVRNTINIESKRVSDFNQVKQLVDNQNNLIINTNHDIEKINSYINHELKNSLAILRLKRMDEDEFDDYIQALSKSIDDISALTTNKIENKNPIDLLLLVAQVVDHYNYYPIDFNFTGDNFTIRGNYPLLTRAIDNIINNAFKYGANKLDINVYNLNESVVVKFTNDGHVISRKELDKIFDYKYRTPELNADGTGIGLALVRNIVELHNGGVFVESQTKQTSFYLSFKTT